VTSYLSFFLSKNNRVRNALEKAARLGAQDIGKAALVEFMGGKKYWRGSILWYSLGGRRMNEQAYTSSAFLKFLDMIQLRRDTTQRL